MFRVLSFPDLLSTLRGKVEAGYRLLAGAAARRRDADNIHLRVMLISDERWELAPILYTEFLKHGPIGDQYSGHVRSVDQLDLRYYSVKLH